MSTQFCSFNARFTLNSKYEIFVLPQNLVQILDQEHLLCFSIQDLNSVALIELTVAHTH